MDRRCGQNVMHQIAMDALRSCAYRENMLSLPVRTISLIAAYAIALHALILALTQPTSLAAPASTTVYVVCTGSASSDRPVEQDHTPCNLDCTMTGCGTGGSIPPSANVIAVIGPPKGLLVLQSPAEITGRIAHKTPQAPRAPPRA
jgi:hypothetical protein